MKTRSRSVELLILGALLLLALVLRARDIDADPPPNLDWSQGLHTDGAVVVQNARNQALWGKAVLDYGIDMYWFPLSYAASLSSFALLGVSTASARAASIALSLGAIVCVAAGLALEGDGGRRRAVLVSLLLATSFPFVMYNRLPLAEPAMIALIAAAFLFFSWGSARGSARLIAVAGFFSAAAPLFGKAHSVYLPLVGFGALLLGRPEDRTRSRLVAYIAGCAAAVVLWLAILVAPHGREIIDHYLHESVVKHEKSAGGTPFFAEAVENAITMGAAKGVGFLSRDIVTVTLAFIALPLLLVRRIRGGGVEHASVRFAALWLVFGWAFLSCVKFPAPRYLTALIPAIAILAGAYLANVWRAAAADHGEQARAASAAAGAKPGASRARLEPRRALGAPATGAIFLLLLLAALVFLAHAGSIGSPFPFLAPLGAAVPSMRSSGYPWSLFLPGAAIAIAATLIVRARAGGASAPSRSLAIALVVVSVLLQAYQYSAWAASSTRTVVDAGRSIGSLLGERAHLVGAYAPALTLDNGFRSSPYFGPEYMGPDHNPELFSQYAISHVVFASRGDFETVRERYPAVFRALIPVAEYPFRSLWADRFVLCRVPSEIGGKKMNDYVATERELAAEKKQSEGAGAAR
ncbi:MAG: ArnT family glycosyltransferase [bacterium]